MLQTKVEGGFFPQLCGNKESGVRISKLLINLSKKKNALNLSIFSKKLSVNTTQIDSFCGLIPISKMLYWIGESLNLRAWMD